MAVLPVVIFHAFPELLRGGFVGVDVFFVISGYLISRGLFNELNQDHFRIGAFYHRRIRRILPALVTILFFSIASGWFLLTASEYKQIGKHIASGALFISNLTLWSESGYFDAATDLKPLMHLWSLGIEEQFYVVWPLILWAGWRARLSLLHIVVVLFAISFTANILWVNQHPTATFYLPMTRFWELLAGALLAHFALSSTNQPLSHGVRADILAWTGMVLIIIAVAFAPEANYPGWWAVFPVVGAVMIISTGEHAWVGHHLLSHPVARWFGHISYPLYLWHWPLQSLLRIVFNETPPPEWRLLFAVAAVPLAWATFAWIETPLRASSSRSTTTFLLTSMMMMGALGYGIVAFHGVPWRKAAELEIANSGNTGQEYFFAYMNSKFYQCTDHEILAKSLQYKSFARCFQSKPDGEVTVALVGDSHAEHLFIGLAEAMLGENVAYYIQEGAPSIENERFSQIFSFVSSSDSVHSIVLSAFWQERSHPNLLGEIAETVSFLRQVKKRIYITNDVPAFSFDAEKCKYAGRFWIKPKCEEEFAFTPIIEFEDTKFPSATVIDTFKGFCHDKYCRMNRGGRLLYRDNNHLNINGSRLIGEQIAKAISADRTSGL